jgi:hypothetical protein
MNMVRTVGIASLLSVLAFAALGSPLDKPYAFDVDLTDPPGKVHVVLSYAGSMEAPITWSILVVTISGSNVFSVEHNDAGLDSFFGDEGYMAGCSGYAACKEMWYGADLPENVRDAFSTVRGTEQRVEDWQIAALRSLATEFLNRKGVPSDILTSALEEMIRLRSQSFTSFCPPQSPVQDDSCYMYVPKLGYFVPYWDD